MTPDTNVQYIDSLRPEPQPVPAHIDVVVPVPVATLGEAWARRGNFMCERIVFEDWLSDGRTEKDLQLLLGAFWAAADALPMLYYDYANWVLDYGCPKTVREAVDEHFKPADGEQAVSSIDPQAKLTSAVQNLADLMDEDEAQGEHPAMYLGMVVEGLWMGLGANLPRLQHIHEELGAILDEERAAAQAAA